MNLNNHYIHIDIELEHNIPQNACNEFVQYISTIKKFFRNQNLSKFDQTKIVRFREMFIREI